MKLIVLILSLVFFLVSSCTKGDNDFEIVKPTEADTIKKTIHMLRENELDFSNSTNFKFDKLRLVKAKLSFETKAIGRESLLGAKDNPSLNLSNNSYTHPSIIYLKNDINGYNFWMALTPYFGKVLQQPDFTSFENPHVFASRDGLNWEEPLGINNPIDTPYAGPFVSYWSDTNIIFYNNILYCYYRGNGFPRNFFQDKKNHYRNIVYKTSTDGINWSKRELLYSTNSIGLDDDSGIVSPSFVYDKDQNEFICYDVVFSTRANPYMSQKNQLFSFVMRRTAKSPSGPYTDHGSDKICNFLNRPWPESHDPWHLEVKRYNGMYFMLLNTGLAGKSNGESLYFGYSKDGINFTMINSPVFEQNVYKSTMLPVELTNESISFYIYQSDKMDGSVNLYKLDLKYSNHGNKE